MAGLWAIASVIAQAETGKYAGVAAETNRESKLFEGADPNANAVGKLPAGSIIILTGERAAGFSEVSVELNEGQVTGWLPDRVIRIATQKARSAPPQDPDNGALETETIKKKRPRSEIPQDEVLLLKREPSFIYGLYLGAHYGLADVLALPSTSTGIGFHFGGQFGIFADRRLPITLELGYGQLGGSTAEGHAASFGLFDIAINAIYLITPRLEAVLTAKYAIGVGILDLPALVTTIASPADVSSFWIQGGMGYRFALSQYADLIVRATYGFALTQTPVGFQRIGMTSLLEIRG